MTDAHESKKHEVINASDFRMPGGTSHSISEEVRVQSAANIPTALVHINSQMMRRALPWSKPMQAISTLPNVDVLTPGDSAHAELLVIRHPSTLKDLSRFLPSVTCNRLIVLANHAATDRDGTANYNPPEIDAQLQKRFNVVPEWRPIGPVVRKTLEPYAHEISVGPDWINIFSMGESPVARRSVHNRPTIGRHSRPQPAKWPDRPADIRSAYPMDAEFDVRILGGSAPAEQVLNKRPSNWTVHEFGSLDPSEFLAEIDFWVYFHHPHTLEAYGRAAMEALYSGCVVILPEYMQDTFGDAALYGTPKDVKDIIREYSSNADKFLAQSAQGQAFASALGPDLHLSRLEQLGVTPAIKSAEGSLAPSTTSTVHAEKKPRLLFITSNGAGMGHLTRTLAVARALREMHSESIFFSLSQGVPVVQDQGFPFEYMGSSAAMHVAPSEWNTYFIQRLENILTRTTPDAVIFDGTVPYNGLVQVLKGLDIYRVWIRRGMWKRESPAKSIRREQYFDLVVEPGEYATEYDEGPTKTHATAEKVGPITLLNPDELLSREEARKALGMDAGSKSILLTLGAGNINSIEDLQEFILSHVAEHHPGWSVYLTRPPISESIGDSSLNVLKTYPLARLANAFDFAISAAGYNSFHEWISMHIPTLWIPNTATSIDDQLARARWAHETGRGYALLGAESTGQEAHDEMASLIDCLIRDDTRVRMREKMGDLDPSNGAAATASLILKGIQR